MRIINYITAVVAILLYSSCEKSQEQYIAENRQSLFSIKPIPDSLYADGVSLLKISARLNQQTNSAANTAVSFTTSYGAFEETNTKTYSGNATVSNGELIASVFLKASINTNDRVFVKIAAAKLDTTLILRFVTAKPDSIYSESAISIVANDYGAEVPFTTFLIRKKGLPSTRQQASYAALRDNGQPIGSFRGIGVAGSDSSGKLNAVFVLRDSTYIGNVRIISKIRGNTKLLTDTVKVNIKKK